MHVYIFETINVTGIGKEFENTYLSLNNKEIPNFIFFI